MTFEQVMSNLEELGTEQNVKIYTRHGAKAPLFGVSFANLNKLKKKLKVNHELALQLMETGNTDAMTLAAMIADPKLITSEQAEHWLQQPAMNYYTLIDIWVSNSFSRSPLAAQWAEQWTKSTEEWIGRAGWQLLNQLAHHHGDLMDEYFLPYLNTIEQQVHSRPNRTREAMNSALISIALRSDELEQRVRDIVTKIGAIKVDHGQTSCKTPEPITYIEKTKQHRLLKKS